MTAWTAIARLQISRLHGAPQVDDELGMKVANPDERAVDAPAIDARAILVVAA